MVGRGQSSPKIGFLEGNISIKVASASLVLSTILYSVAAACQGLHQLPFTPANHLTIPQSEAPACQGLHQLPFMQACLMTILQSQAPACQSLHQLQSRKGIFSPSDRGNHYGRELPVFNVLIINVVLVSVRKSVILIARARHGIIK